MEVSCVKQSGDYEEQYYSISYRKYYENEEDRDRLSWRSASSGKIYGLDFNTVYEFKCVNTIRTSKCNNENSMATIRQTTHHTVECPNFKVEISSRTSSSLKVVWDNDKDLDYKIQYRKCNSQASFETITRFIDGRVVEWITEDNIKSLQKDNLLSAQCYEFSMQTRGLSNKILTANCRPFEYTLPTKPNIFCANNRVLAN